LRNGVKCALHAWPAGEAQQDFASRPYAGDGRNDFAGIGRAQNVETRQYRAVLVGLPTHKREDLVGCEADDASAPIENALEILRAKPQPVLDLPFVKDEHDLRHRYCHCDTPKLSVEIGKRYRSPTAAASNSKPAGR
jgi:hypothetical protein